MTRHDVLRILAQSGQIERVRLHPTTPVDVGFTILVLFLALLAVLGVVWG